jgi:hypothetical protein
MTENHWNSGEIRGTDVIPPFRAVLVPSMEEWAFDFRFVHARVEPRIELVGAWDELGDRQ